MEELELVSIIMPAYNAAKFIAESISSVIAQTYKNWELIVVDDGSTDDTKNIIQEFVTLDDRIRYVYQKNARQGKARNTGIAIAKSELIAFLDADDLWLPHMLESQTKLLCIRQADLVFSQVKFIDTESNPLDDFHGVSRDTFEGVTGLQDLIKGNTIPIATVLSKKDAVLKAGAFKNSHELQYGEDYDLWLRMLLTGAKLVCNAKPVALYRKHQLQSSKLTGTKYIQLLTIINSVPDNILFREKQEAMKLWLKRSMRYTKPINHSVIRKLIHFIPSHASRNLSLAASYILPLWLLRRVVFVLSNF